MALKLEISFPGSRATDISKLTAWLHAYFITGELPIHSYKFSKHSTATTKCSTATTTKCSTTAATKCSSTAAAKCLSTATTTTATTETATTAAAIQHKKILMLRLVSSGW